MSNVVDPLSVVKLITKPEQVDHRIDLNRYFAQTVDGQEVELPLPTWRALFKALLENPLRQLVRTRVGIELAARGDEILIRWLDPAVEDAKRPVTIESAVAQIVAMGKDAKPDLAKRLDSAAELVLLGRVAVVDGKSAKVSVYNVTAESCECPDFIHRGGWCKHRLAVRMARHLVTNGYSLPLPHDEPVTVSQISAKDLALIASGKVIDNAIRERVAYSKSNHGARTAALRMMANGAKTLPADLALRAGIGGRESDRKQEGGEIR